MMKPGEGSIITEDGQRLTLHNGEITGTESAKPGLAYETGNTTLNEPVNTESVEDKKDTGKGQ